MYLHDIEPYFGGVKREIFTDKGFLIGFIGKYDNVSSIRLISNFKDLYNLTGKDFEQLIKELKKLKPTMYKKLVAEMKNEQL